MEQLQLILSWRSNQISNNVLLLRREILTRRVKYYLSWVSLYFTSILVLKLFRLNGVEVKSSLTVPQKMWISGKKSWCFITSGLYYKHVTIVNYTSSFVNNLRASLNDNARVIIYDCHMFIVQATGCHG